jgi:hypothetical protein
MSSIRLIFAAFLVTLLIGGLVGTTTVSGAGTLVHLYDLNGSYADALGGPALSPEGGTLGSSRFSFDAGDGLALFDGLESTASYSIVLIMEFDALGGSYQKIIDYEDLDADEGLYIFDDSLLFYDETGEGPTNVSPNTDFQVVLTRDSRGDEVRGYVNGVLQWTFSDSDNFAVSSLNILHFFVDDSDTSGTEAEAGSVDCIAIYDGSLTLSQITALGTESCGVEELEATATPVIVEPIRTGPSQAGFAAAVIGAITTGVENSQQAYGADPTAVAIAPPSTGTGTITPPSAGDAGLLSQPTPASAAFVVAVTLVGLAGLRLLARRVERASGRG